MAPSILLQHIHRSLPTIARLYPAGVFPVVTDRASAAEGERVVDFFCHELQLGAGALRQWREYVQASQRRHLIHPLPPPSAATAATRPGQAGSTLFPNILRPPNGYDGSAVWPMEIPYTAEQQLLSSAVSDLHAVVSPFVALSPAATAGAAATAFHARCDIEPGMFLLSLPSAAAFYATPPPSTDPLLSYFLTTDDLVGQLCVAGDPDVSEDPASRADEGAGSATHGAPDSRRRWFPSHYTYANYLKLTVTPCRNLPFLRLEEVKACFGAMPSASSAGGDTAVPVAVQLWRFFHEEMCRRPLSEFLNRYFSPDEAAPAATGELEEYLWWTSLVLSRRVMASTLLPLVDKLNHAPNPNCYYTMSTSPGGHGGSLTEVPVLSPHSTFTALDVVDNLCAGVPLPHLMEPYVHVFAIRRIRKGEELTLSYSSAPTRSSGAAGRGAAPDAATVQEARAAWLMQWGFIPEADTVYSESDLREVAGIVAERRIDLRSQLFPPDPAAS